MLDDNLEKRNVENAILKGRIDKRPSYGYDLSLAGSRRKAPVLTADRIRVELTLDVEVELVR